MREMSRKGVSNCFAISLLSFAEVSKEKKREERGEGGGGGKGRLGDNFTINDVIINAAIRVR